MTFIMVLNDGETYTSLAGCSIVAIPEHFGPNEIEEALDQINAHEETEAQVVTVFEDRA